MASVTKDFEITPVKLTNLVFSKPYDGNNKIEQTLDSTNGVIEGDTVTIVIKLQDEDIGNNKLATSITLYDENNKITHNYSIEPASISCSITKEVKSFTISNADDYTKIYQDTRVSVPNTKTTGLKNVANYVTKFYKVDGEKLTVIDRENVSKEIGKYRIVITASDANYAYEFKKDFDVVKIDNYDMDSADFTFSVGQKKIVLLDSGRERRIFKFVKPGVTVKILKCKSENDYFTGEIKSISNTAYYLGGFGKTLAEMTSTIGFSRSQLFSDITWLPDSGQINMMPLILGENEMISTSTNPVKDKAVQFVFDVKEKGEGHTSFTISWDITTLTVFYKKDNYDFAHLPQTTTRVEATTAIEFIIIPSTNDISTFKIGF